MVDDSFEFVETPAGQTYMLEDRISSRVLAYITLMQEIRNHKDEHLVTEGMKMLERLRLSITITPERDVSVVKGGKS